jgi:hypothetical protein
MVSVKNRSHKGTKLDFVESAANIVSRAIGEDRSPARPHLFALTTVRIDDGKDP